MNMSPRENKFNFLMTNEEKQKLEELAKSEDRTAGGWLRSMINREYAEKFGAKPPKKSKK